MPKQKITIHLDSEIAEKLRLQSIEKYHNFRSMSKMIEDLVTGATEAKQPEACSILSPMTGQSFIEEKEFNRIVEMITKRLPPMGTTHVRGDGRDFLITEPEMYFALKEACELALNRYADEVNVCYGSKGLTGPLPKFPNAGKNFEIYATMDSNLR